MERLMDTDPYNRAIPKKLIGDDMFGDTYTTCSTTCQKQTDCDECPIQEAFARLRQYEQTGLTPEEIMELVERDAAVLLEDIVANKKDNGRLLFGTCPKCKTRVSNIEGGNFCQNCGQRVKWEE